MRPIEEGRQGQILDAPKILMHRTVRNIQPAILNTIVRENRRRLIDNQDYTKLQEPHIANSRSRMLATAKTAVDRAPDGKMRKALIIGAGNLVDTPVVDLTQLFDEVTLVDIDRVSTEEALRNMRPALNGKKINVVVADASGVMEKYAEIMRRASLLPTVDQFTAETEAIALLPVVDTAPKLGDDFTFVSSQLVMSQLGHFPYEYLDTIIGDKYRRQLPPGSSLVDKFFLSQQTLINCLRQEHIRYLARLVDPQGTVHLADTYTHFGDSKPSPIIRPDLVNPVLEECFNPLVPAATWVFNSTPGESYRIIAHSLEPKR